MVAIFGNQHMREQSRGRDAALRRRDVRGGRWGWSGRRIRAEAEFFLEEAEHAGDSLAVVFRAKVGGTCIVLEKLAIVAFFARRFSSAG